MSLSFGDSSALKNLGQTLAHRAAMMKQQLGSLDAFLLVVEAPGPAARSKEMSTIRTHAWS